MADEALNNTPSSTNPGPPPTGGGSFDENSKLIGKWKPDVVAAYQALNPGAIFDPAALDATQPFNRLDRLQKIQRRQLEQLTIARKLYRIQNGNWAPSDRVLRDFFLQPGTGISQIWQTALGENSLSGIPKLFSDNYTLAETEDWLTDRGLLSFSPSASESKKEILEEASDQKGQVSPVEKSDDGKVAAKPGTQAFTGTVKPVDGVSAPQQPRQPAETQGTPAEEFDDDEESNVSLPGGLEGVSLANQLASAARQGPRRTAAQQPLSKRAAKRERGKARASKRASTAAQVQSTPDVQDDSAQLTQQMQSAQASAQQDAEITAEAAAGGGASAVTSGSQVSAAVAAAAKVKPEVAETGDALTPGFAEGEGGQAQKIGLEAQAEDGFVRPGMVQPKARGAQSAKGETIGIEASDADQAGSGGQGEVGLAGGRKGVGSPKAQGVQAEQQQAGVARSAKAARPTAEAEEEAAEAAVVARGPAQVDMKGGVDAEIEGKEVPEAQADNTQKSQPEINNQEAPEQQQEGSVEKLQPSDDLVPQATETPKTKSAKSSGREGKPESSGGQGLGEGEELSPAGEEQQQQDEPQDQEEQEARTGDDFIPPQFAPGEYQTPKQKAQVDQQKRTSAAKDKARDARQGKPVGKEEPEDAQRPMSDGQALDRFASMNPAEQLAHINGWLGKTSQKKKRMPSIGGLKLRLLEAAALKYPELKELLDEIKVESYKAAHGLSDLPGRSRKQRGENMEDEFWFWVKKVFAEYVLKTWLFPYITISAFFDGGVEAVLALIGLHIYWFIGMIFKNSGYWQGLLRWQKWMLAGIDALVGFVILFVVLVAVYGFCQLPGVGLASKAASYITTDVTYTFCNDLNAGIGNISNSPAGQNLAPSP